MILSSPSTQAKANTPLFESPSIQTTRDTIAALQDVLQLRISALHDPTALDFYQQVKDHRREYYQCAAPHLLTESEQQIEQSVDLRSRLYCVLHKGRILASLRLTPRPFELEQFEISDFSKHPFLNYWELGRLVTEIRLEPLTAALIVRFLLCAAGLDAIENLNCQGLVAICRPHRLSFFKKFGLQEHSNFKSLSRDIEYVFMSSPMQTVLDVTSALQFSEKAMRQRLERFDFAMENHAQMD